MNLTSLTDVDAALREARELHGMLDGLAQCIDAIEGRAGPEGAIARERSRGADCSLCRPGRACG
jgi:hypothetical protein